MNILLIDLLGDIETLGLNIGLAYLSAHLRDADHHVSLLDTVNIRTGNISDRIQNAVNKTKPEIIGLSIFSANFILAREEIQKLKKYFNGKIVVGGPEITNLKERTFEELKDIDIAIIGEGEETFVELINSLKNSHELSKVDGIIWKNGNIIISNSPRKTPNELDSYLYFPDYSVYGIQGIDVYPINTSRGCPYSCSFCFNPDRRWRARSPKNIVEELKFAKKQYSIKLFHIVDASFNINIKRVEEFCDLLIDEKIDLPWVIQGFRADKSPDSMLDKMHKARCRRIWVGIETMDKEVYAQINKSETLDDILVSIKRMRRFDWEIFGYMVIGLPGDTYKKTMRSFNKARKLDLDLLAYASAVHMTGTPLEKWVFENAKQLASSYEISSIGSQYGNIAFETSEFTKEERIKARKIISIKAGSYSEVHINPQWFRYKKWMLVLRYDWKNIFSHLKKSLKYRINYNKNVDSINIKRGLYLSKIPDGTWGLGKEDSLQKNESPHFMSQKL